MKRITRKERKEQKREYLKKWQGPFKDAPVYERFEKYPVRKFINDRIGVLLRNSKTGRELDDASIYKLILATRNFIISKLNLSRENKLELRKLYELEIDVENFRDELLLRPIYRLPLVNFLKKLRDELKLIAYTKKFRESDPNVEWMIDNIKNNITPIISKLEKDKKYCHTDRITLDFTDEHILLYATTKALNTIRPEIDLILGAQSRIFSGQTVNATVAFREIFGDKFTERLFYIDRL